MARRRGEAGRSGAVAGVDLDLQFGSAQRRTRHEFDRMVHPTITRPFSIHECWIPQPHRTAMAG
jgi:hypothetical protein